ncbi:MAG: 16S rRNA (cytidine(1402)-2'-O)-methyltransferase [Steroidobacteraceae bacterium]
MVKAPGKLLVVATPIGNLGDLSPRARQTLAAVAVIAAEDTRHTRTLLKAAGVATPLVSLHAHNESQRVPELLARLGQGEDIALVSDAGTPLLSDPGFELVTRASQAGVAVHTVPGPSAITAALAVAGLPTQRFCFEGFLPARPGERRAALARLAHETRTLVFFEAPHRIQAMLADLAEEFGAGRQAVVARELTKAHETLYRGTLGELSARARAEENFARGELTLVVRGAEPGGEAVPPELRHTMEILLRELPPGRAAAVAVQLTGATRAAAYALATRAGARAAAAAPEPEDEEMP